MDTIFSNENIGVNIAIGITLALAITIAVVFVIKFSFSSKKSGQNGSLVDQSGANAGGDIVGRDKITNVKDQEDA
ncbi:hypothetical protein [Pseudovibrio brasiliensis]|uniref:Uncharacterized protein n=1 Tax=Pseudovibrio brasiliensis TaxID=1898042 RepID=A0ABX8AQK4_9HYPH|nr:hypothetical protein [Pseudovibrio brasiliensis]QUS57379.1 hypothetical protein KGB56_08300 [Pseudovibrio brasiliensis]